uniref:Putative lectin/glucanase superfamily protein n=1 Tax=viral metagenome TaxID=1070528 RepID=A0A6M3KLM2_9ZZZZ
MRFLRSITGLNADSLGLHPSDSILTINEISDSLAHYLLLSAINDTLANKHTLIKGDTIETVYFRSSSGDSTVFEDTLIVSTYIKLDSMKIPDDVIGFSDINRLPETIALYLLRSVFGDSIAAIDSTYLTNDKIGFEDINRLPETFALYIQRETVRDTVIQIIADSALTNATEIQVEIEAIRDTVAQIIADSALTNTTEQTAEIADSIAAHNEADEIISLSDSLTIRLLAEAFDDSVGSIDSTYISNDAIGFEDVNQLPEQLALKQARAATRDTVIQVLTDSALTSQAEQTAEIADSLGNYSRTTEMRSEMSDTTTNAITDDDWTPTGDWNFTGHLEYQGDSVATHSDVMLEGFSNDSLKFYGSFDYSTYRDYSGLNNDGSASGGVIQATNARQVPVGLGADSLDGDDYVNINAVIDDIDEATEGTITFWMRTVDATPAAEMVMIGFGDTDGDEYLKISLMTDATIQVASRDAGVNQFIVATDNAVISNDTKHHIAVVQNGTSPVIYINGIRTAFTFSVSSDVLSWFYELTGVDNGRIGALNYNSAGNDDFYTGVVDEVKIWNRALTAEEIYNDYLNAGLIANLLLADLFIDSIAVFDIDSSHIANDDIGFEDVNQLPEIVDLKLYRADVRDSINQVIVDSSLVNNSELIASITSHGTLDSSYARTVAGDSANLKVDRDAVRDSINQVVSDSSLVNATELQAEVTAVRDTVNQIISDSSLVNNNELDAAIVAAAPDSSWENIEADSLLVRAASIQKLKVDTVRTDASNNVIVFEDTLSVSNGIHLPFGKKLSFYDGGYFYGDMGEVVRFANPSGVLLTFNASLLQMTTEKGIDFAAGAQPAESELGTIWFATDSTLRIDKGSSISTIAYTSVIRDSMIKVIEDSALVNATELAALPGDSSLVNATELAALPGDSSLVNATELTAELADTAATKLSHKGVINVPADSNLTIYYSPNKYVGYGEYNYPITIWNETNPAQHNLSSYTVPSGGIGIGQFLAKVTNLIGHANYVNYSGFDVNTNLSDAYSGTGVAIGYDISGLYTSSAGWTAGHWISNVSNDSTGNVAGIYISNSLGASGGGTAYPIYSLADEKSYFAGSIQTNADLLADSVTITSPTYKPYDVASFGSGYAYPNYLAGTVDTIEVIALGDTIDGNHFPAIYAWVPEDTLPVINKLDVFLAPMSIPPYYVGVDSIPFWVRTGEDTDSSSVTVYIHEYNENTGLGSVIDSTTVQHNANIWTHVNTLTSLTALTRNDKFQLRFRFACKSDDEWVIIANMRWYWKEGS